MKSGVGQTLGLMTYDDAASPPLFGAPAVIATDASHAVAWPSFTPDGNAVLFHAGDSFDTSGGSGVPHYADLRLADLADGNKVATLDALNAWSSSGAGATYLPYGAAEEAHSNYEPAVLPVAVGGYYWVVFTSRRCYGNTLAPGGTTTGGDNRWGSVVMGNEVPSIRKKLWIAALDVTAAAGKDRSHPAFYLPGQELEAGNMRAFAALEPCKANGVACESAADCCGGFCRPSGTSEAGVPSLTCVPKPSGCSHEDESCTVTADCCDAPAGYECLNSRCTRPTPG